MNKYLAMAIKFVISMIDKKKAKDWIVNFFKDIYKKRINRSDIAAIGLGAASLTMVTNTASEVDTMSKKVDTIDNVISVNDSTGVIMLGDIEISN